VTARQIYLVVRAALDGAVRDQLIARNPAAAVARPGVARREARHLDASDAATGLRRGEALALSWDAVDLDAGILTVVATLGRFGARLVISEPKTDRSRRTVPLNPAIVTLLRRHKATQAAERLRAGDSRTDSGLVFTTELGRPIDPRNLLRVLETAAAAVGIAGAGVHTLRHSAAVAWLEGGTHIKAVADLLAHSSIALTGDVYGHTTDTARAAVDGLASRLGL
jgi:integrase